MSNIEYIERAKLPDNWPSAEEQGYHGDGWYFWDETGSYCHGPYVAEVLAAKALEHYIEHLDSMSSVLAAVSMFPNI